MILFQIKIKNDLFYDLFYDLISKGRLFHSHDCLFIRRGLVMGH
jgi:hypothetical protein